MDVESEIEANELDDDISVMPVQDEILRKQTEMKKTSDKIYNRSISNATFILYSSYSIYC